MYAGGCLCGDVRWKTGAEPRSSSICHCVACRRSSGAPMVAWLGFRRAEMEISGHTTAFASSPESQRHHCHRCGTQLFMDDVADAEHIDVTTASLDDPNLASPRRHIWARSRIDWVELDDGLPAYAPDGADGDQLLTPARNPA